MTYGEFPEPMTATAHYPEGFVPNSRKGQHILLDQAIIDQTAALVPEGERSIEIGAGTGELTEALLERGGEVIAYEVDERCEPALSRFGDDPNFTVRWQNFLEAPLEDIESSDPYHIVGNIPFHISEPLMLKLTEVRFSSAVLLVGSNLVRSMVAPHPDHDSWSRLSLVTRGFFSVERIADVPRESFDPPPRVDAEVVRLTRQDADPSWKTDAVSRAYRALVEADTSHTTAARALKSVVVTPRGDAQTVGGNRTTNRRTDRRSQRRKEKSELTSIRDEYNSSRHAGAAARPAKANTSEDMHHIVSASVDDEVLSKPLSGLSNYELRKICSAVTTAINRRKKIK